MAETNFVLIELTGREADSKKIFETTSKELAEKEEIASENREFKPICVLLGNNELFPVLEKALTEMKENESRKIELTPEQAFGERKKDLVRVIPIKQFKDNKMNPFPGLIIEADGLRGRVQTVSGGRVRVDFNNDLAGKNIEYELKLIKKVTDSKEKAKHLTEKYLPIPEVDYKMEKEKITITLPSGLPKEISFVKNALEKQLKEAIPEIKEVEFKEKEVKKEEKESKESKETQKENSSKEKKNNLK
ncbi:MAG: peptidylprolyl isomerase [Candidatus Diapherotrites archaeon]|nr:peptidylprolyl isomerase [Candidatus Diapherotrites archaeon]